MKIIDKRNGSNKTSLYAGCFTECDSEKYMIFYDKQSRKFRYIELDTGCTVGFEYDTIEEMAEGNPNEKVINVELHIID